MRRSLLALCCLALLSARLSAAATAALVRDIDILEPSFSSGFGGVQGPIVALPGKALLTAVDSSGLELWASDGTPTGTALLRDFCPGECSSNLELLGAAGKVGLFTFGNDFGRQPTELWRSDGTPAGTFRIASSASGGPEKCLSSGARVTATLGSTLFFSAQAPGGCGLWRSDGSAAGTRRVEDAATDRPGFEPADLVTAGGKLYFLGQDLPALWRTDARAESATRLADFPAGALLRSLRVSGSRLFFFAFDHDDNRELWTSNGTAAGTSRVTRSESGFFDGREVLQVFDGVAWFLAKDGQGVVDLWRSDGTAAGTRRLTDVRSTNAFYAGLPLVKLGGRVLFTVFDGNRRLWASGGTPETTAPLTGCAGGACPAVQQPFVQVGNRAVFAASDTAHGIEIWSTDGTAAGTRLLRDLCPGPCSSSPAWLTPLLGRAVFLAALPAGGGFGLWRTDGTPAGTVLFTFLGPQPFPSFDGFSPATIGKAFLFAASDGRRPSQLWASDATPQGTGPLTVIGSGPGSSPDSLLRLGDKLLFRACDSFDRSLWTSGGTFATTVPLAPTSTACQDDNPAGQPVAIGNLAYFTKGARFSQDLQLWRTDGTDAGTFQLTRFTGARVTLPVAFAGKAVFARNESSGIAALWETDGTVAGTRELFDFPVDPDSFFNVQLLTAAGARLYFFDFSGIGWVSDGTAAGTRPLNEESSVSIEDDPEITQAGGWVYILAEDGLWKSDGVAEAQKVPLPAGVFLPANLAAFKGLLYFTAHLPGGEGARGVFKTDGTAQGTVLLAPVAPPYDFRPEPAWFTVVGDRLFFVADDGHHGLELWQTDGTPAGSSLVRDIAPGQASSSPSDLAVAGGLLYFAAADPAHGVELWQSDGTAAGTHLVQDIAPGAASASPAALTAAGDHLFFTADDGLTGEELWALPLAAPTGCQPSDEVLCLNGGRFRVEATWRDPQGRTGKGHGVALTGDTGYFWFFTAANVEVILKVLDGTGTNGHRWVFYGALSNVEYTLTVTDTVTGAARRYVNPPGRLGSVADTLAFGPLGATGAGTVSRGPEAAPAPPPLTARSQVRAAAACTPSATRLCLNNGRFAVEARWRDFQGNTGMGTTRELSGDTGSFWFFGAANLELVVKVLDGRPVNGKIWVFYGALSNVEYTLTVTDTETGAVKIYTNPSGRLASVADTAAF